MPLEFLEYLSKSSSKPKQLIILVHGYGSNGHDLISVAPEIAEHLPEAHFVSPHAPFPFEGGEGFGYQWFSLMERTEKFMLEGARKAEKLFNQFIDDQLKRFNLTAHELALVGFSQGTMMSLHNSLRRSDNVKAVLGYSGMLLGPNILKAEIKAKPEVMLIHGAQDMVLPSQAMYIAEGALKDVGVNCSSMLRPHLGHGIDKEGIDAGVNFLKNAFQIKG
jgi:phospholipase/carboxylesterase